MRAGREEEAVQQRLWRQQRVALIMAMTMALALAMASKAEQLITVLHRG